MREKLKKPDLIQMGVIIAIAITLAYMISGVC